MSLIDLVARTASRQELVQLLRGTEEQRQRLQAALEAIVQNAPKEKPKTEHGDCIAAAQWAEWHLASYARDALANTRSQTGAEDGQ